MFQLSYILCRRSLLSLVTGRSPVDIPLNRGRLRGLLSVDGFLFIRGGLVCWSRVRWFRWRTLQSRCREQELALGKAKDPAHVCATSFQMEILWKAKSTLSISSRLGKDNGTFKVIGYWLPLHVLFSLHFRKISRATVLILSNCHTCSMPWVSFI